MLNDLAEATKASDGKKTAYHKIAALKLALPEWFLELQRVVYSMGGQDTFENT